MSEEKLYVVKNDEGKYWSFNDEDEFWQLDGVFCIAAVSEDTAKNAVKEHGGHVVPLIEEPKKVVLPRKAAEWIDIVKDGGYDITYIFTEHLMSNEVSDWLEDSDDDAEHREERGLMLINAYLYGYTVAKQKKYNVKVPHTEDVWYYKSWNGTLQTIGQGGEALRGKFTEAEIEHYGLQDCKKEEVTDDEQ